MNFILKALFFISNISFLYPKEWEIDYEGTKNEIKVPLGAFEKYKDNNLPLEELEEFLEKGYNIFHNGAKFNRSEAYIKSIRIEKENNTTTEANLDENKVRIGTRKIICAERYKKVYVEIRKRVSITIDFKIDKLTDEAQEKIDQICKDLNSGNRGSLTKEQICKKFNSERIDIKFPNDCKEEIHQNITINIKPAIDFYKDPSDYNLDNIFLDVNNLKGDNNLNDVNNLKDNSNLNDDNGLKNVDKLENDKNKSISNNTKKKCSCR